jgi:energy-coupling factor transporter ATP-binding protein EcfA2
MESPNKNQQAVSALVELFDGSDLFRTADRTAFITFKIGDHLETWPIRSETFKSFVRFVFYRSLGFSPPSRVINDFRDEFCARAEFDGPERRVFLRVGEQDGNIFLDLCDEGWRAVKITAGGWEIADANAVKFLRAPGMLPLPIPIPGGNLSELSQFLNLPNKDEEALFLCSLVADLRPRGPFPIMLITGEHGSGKSTLSRIRRALIDPSQAPVQSAPRSERDLQIAAANSWLVVLDNLSHLDAQLSDSLCRLATGGGLRTRKLYSDADERIFSALRPTTINSIEELPTRGDFLDRCVTIRTPRIAGQQRRPEKEFWREFDAAKPRILGALLDAVSAALRNIASVRLDRYPRMADFAAWAVAAEPGLGLKSGTFLRAYEANRAEANRAAIEVSPIGEAIIDFMLTVKGISWRGDLKKLLNILKLQTTDEQRT